MRHIHRVKHNETGEDTCNGKQLDYMDNGFSKGGAKVF